jgi:hypothetical protein
MHPYCRVLRFVPSATKDFSVERQESPNKACFKQLTPLTSAPTLSGSFMKYFAISGCWARLCHEVFLQKT